MFKKLGKSILVASLFSISSGAESIKVDQVQNSTQLLKDIGLMYKNSCELIIEDSDISLLLNHYSLTKNTLGIEFSKDIGAVILDVILNKLKVGYDIKGHKELDDFIKYIQILSEGNIEIELSSDMPKNSEFTENITINGEINGNILIINKSGFFDSFLNTAEYNLNFSELSSSFISDLPSSDKIILGKIAETNSLYIDIKSKLSTARRRISTLEHKLSSLNELHNESIINTEKRLVELSIIQKRDVKKINDINVKKISDLKIEHKNEVIFLKNTIKKLKGEINTYVELLKEEQKNYKQNLNSIDGDIKTNSVSLIEANNNISDLNQQNKNLEDKIIILEDKIKKLKEELLNKDSQNSSLVSENEVFTITSSKIIESLKKEKLLAVFEKNEIAKRLEASLKQIEDIKKSQESTGIEFNYFEKLNINEKNIGKYIKDVRFKIQDLKKNITNIKFSDKKIKKFKTQLKSFIQIEKLFVLLENNIHNINKLNKTELEYEVLNNSLVKSQKSNKKLKKEILQLQLKEKKSNSIISSQAKKIELSGEYYNKLDENKDDLEKRFELKLMKIKEGLNKALLTIKNQKAEIESLNSENKNANTKNKELKNKVSEQGQKIKELKNNLF